MENKNKVSHISHLAITVFTVILFIYFSISFFKKGVTGDFYLMIFGGYLIYSYILVAKQIILFKIDLNYLHVLAIIINIFECFVYFKVSDLMVNNLNGYTIYGVIYLAPILIGITLLSILLTLLLVRQNKKNKEVIM